jgi:hypothetical protein
VIDNQESKLSKGSWAGLGKELKKRTIEPLFHASFVIYFIVSVVIVGGAGIWLEIYAYNFPPLVDSGPPSLAALRTAFVTFFSALAGSACMQLIWAEDYLRSLRAFATLVLVVTSILALIVAIPAIHNVTALCIGVASSLVALWIWWVANAKQKDLLDPDAPTGGDPSAPLAGNLQGFNV